jgi:hypothetical protein
LVLASDEAQERGHTHGKCAAGGGDCGETGSVTSSDSFISAIRKFIRSVYISYDETKGTTARD